MAKWLSPEQVAEALGITRRKANEIMHGMPHTVISGEQRKRIRVTEDALEAWLVEHSNNRNPASHVVGRAVGTDRRLRRR